MRKTIIVAAATVALCAIAGGLLLARDSAPDRASVAALQPTWDEVAWPFPMDQWGKGKAFVCKAAHCGADVTVYIRAKIGFCNCATGVADDEELDRISDFDLFGNKLTALGPGQPIAVAWMKGRSRAFSIAGSPAQKSALSVGFNDRCDAIVATAVLRDARPGAIEPAVLAFLNSRTVLRWAEVTLGL
jgi:hypothetical protein